MQIQLNKYGFDAGPEDGVFGSRTLHAYTAFLKTQNREADAYLSGQTIRYLKSVANDYPRLSPKGRIADLVDPVNTITEIKNQCQLLRRNFASAHRKVLMLHDEWRYARNQPFPNRGQVIFDKNHAISHQYVQIQKDSLADMRRLDTRAQSITPEGADKACDTTGLRTILMVSAR